MHSRIRTANVSNKSLIEIIYIEKQSRLLLDVFSAHQHLNVYSMKTKRVESKTIITVDPCMRWWSEWKMKRVRKKGERRACKELCSVVRQSRRFFFNIVAFELAGLLNVKIVLICEIIDYKKQQQQRTNVKMAFWIGFRLFAKNITDSRGFDSKDFILFEMTK